MKRFQASVVVAILTVLPGCGVLGAQQGPPGAQGERGADGPPGPPGFSGPAATESGSRIKAVYLTTDDGAKTPIGWLDADTSLRCSFVVAGDGFTRCLPIVPRSDLIRVFYASSDCAGYAVAVGVEKDSAPCSPVGPYAVDRHHVTCDDGLEVYAVGSKYTGEDPSYYSDGAGCFANPGIGYAFFDASRVEPTTFVGSSTKVW